MPNPLTRPFTAVGVHTWAINEPFRYDLLHHSGAPTGRAALPDVEGRGEYPLIAVECCRRAPTAGRPVGSATRGHLQHMLVAANLCEGMRRIVTTLEPTTTGEQRYGERIRAATVEKLTPAVVKSKGPLQGVINSAEEAPGRDRRESCTIE